MLTPGGCLTVAPGEAAGGGVESRTGPRRRAVTRGRASGQHSFREAARAGHAPLTGACVQEQASRCGSGERGK